MKIFKFKLELKLFGKHFCKTNQTHFWYCNKLKNACHVLLFYLICYYAVNYYLFKIKYILLKRSCVGVSGDITEGMRQQIWSILGIFPFCVDDVTQSHLQRCLLMFCMTTEKIWGVYWNTAVCKEVLSSLESLDFINKDLQQLFHLKIFYCL